MVKENIHQCVEVEYLKVDSCPIGNKQYSFFEMNYIISGSGQLILNANKMAYRAGNLLLLTPNDHHAFEISTTTEFLLIRFNSSYIQEYQWKNIHHMECLLYYATHLSGCVIHDKADGVLVKQIVESILDGINSSNLYYEDLNLHFINALIVIAARNISKIRPPHLKVNTDKRIVEIINHIQNNIYCPPKLTALAMGEAFDISETYLGSYFKNHCGETIQQYISSYRMRLIEHRLKFSDRRINEIAAEFGFSDGSHLNKLFKKHKKMSLTAYRKTIGKPLPSQ
ncbi:AraC family transcriptional regulator [Pedobacter sp. HMWF019]|uniref:AraC family transcriptional regulator n=1 Tax=Pedobacter sp. HMWF019 TaxID=2056856 RepID=UPI000D3A94FF|nr:AraC family transcriptional regulator [Pedobacter sp. HMWF019]PTS96036.1 AraC family transcriptional regulator [Pedobacter sp. HMWF019]